MVNLCTASVGNIAVGSGLRISVCILTLALVVHSPGVKRSPSDGESKRHRGRPVLGSHRPGRGPRLLLGGAGGGGAESRRVSGQTLRFSQGKGLFFTPALPPPAPRAAPAGRGSRGPGGERCFSPGGGCVGVGRG